MSLILITDKTMDFDSHSFKGNSENVASVSKRKEKGILTPWVACFERGAAVLPMLIAGNECDCKASVSTPLKRGPVIMFGF